MQAVTMQYNGLKIKSQEKKKIYSQTWASIGFGVRRPGFKS